MGGGGYVGDIVEIGTGGMVKSGKTKEAINKAKEAEQLQKNEIAKQKAEVLAEEEKRKKGILMARQGRRSLMWQGTDELGVQKKTTLGS